MDSSKKFADAPESRRASKKISLPWTSKEILMRNGPASQCWDPDGFPAVTAATDEEPVDSGFFCFLGHALPACPFPPQ